MKKLLLASFILAFGFWSCNNGGSAPKPTTKTLCDSSTFSNLVLPVFTKNCNLAGCHSQGAGGIDLRKYDPAKAAGLSGKMLPAINRTAGGTKNMPPAAALTKRELDILTCWINNGCLP